MYAAGRSTPEGCSDCRTTGGVQRVADFAKVGQREEERAGEEEELSPELDAFVNAATWPFRCYQAPVMAYYGNDRIGKFALALVVRIMAYYLL